MLYKFYRGLSRLVLKLFCRIEVKGRDVFPSGNFVLASNHMSNLDPVVVGVSCPHSLYYLAKEELFKNKFFAFILHGCNAIPLKRNESDISTMRLALKILKDKSLLVFPQGSRSSDYENVKAGIGFLVKKANVPVVAARIYGSDKLLPKGAKFIQRGTIKVIFDRVNTIQENDSYEAIAAKVMEKIKSL